MEDQNIEYTSSCDRAIEKIRINIHYEIGSKILNEVINVKINDNLGNVFINHKKRRKIHDIKNNSNYQVFLLIRDNEQKILDKNMPIKILDLKNDDLIIVTDKQNIQKLNTINLYNIKIKDTVIQNNLNHRKKQTFKYLIISLIILFTLGIIIFLLLYFLKPHNKKPKNYASEELITKKRPYYPINTLFLYKSNKEMNINLESEMDTINENNKTKIKQLMDFNLIIREDHQDIDENKNLSIKWFTGYLSILNLTINNGTHDMSMIYNSILHKYINNHINDKSNQIIRNLNEIIQLNEENEICFIKFNFYENGNIKDIFLPETFNQSNMIYIDEAIKFIIPKLSKNLYSENIEEKIEQLDKLFDSSDLGEEGDLYDENLTNLESDLLEDISFLRRNSENKTSDENEEIYNGSDYEYEYNSDYFNNELNDSQKFFLKEFNENDIYSNITDFELENVESIQAKLEGSKLRKIRNSFLDEKGMLYNVIEYEKVTLIQPGKETLTELNYEEDKLRSEIYNDNNQIPREDEQNFIGKDISFNISSIISENTNNITLQNYTNKEKLIRNIFRYFDTFVYMQYNKTENDNKKLRFLKFK